MASWATKRRFIYGGVSISILTLLILSIFWFTLYKKPSCSDGKKNGDETGIDCGGSCNKLCTTDALKPVVLWSKIFNISGDVYSAVAYIENPNVSSKNPKAHYVFKIFDDQNKLILTKEGDTSIPKNKKIAVFETGIVIKNAKPKTVDFEFTAFSSWEKDNKKSDGVSLNYGTLTSTSTTPKISGFIYNESTEKIEKAELAVIIFDGKENAVAASRTFIDNLVPKSSQDFVFTWPKKFDLGVEECINPVDLVVALDRSGSMKSESTDPPEPFTTVKTTAISFIKNLKEKDAVSIVSFGDNAQKESALSLDKQKAIDAIDKFILNTKILEQTNITAGLESAKSEVESSSRSNSKKVIILLTDGLPTEPKSVGISDYPMTSAQNIANELKSSGIEIYTIGLGKNVSEIFLKSISTDDTHYFLAPDKETLSNIYNKIGFRLCEKKPNVINVIYRAI